MREPAPVNRSRRDGAHGQPGANSANRIPLLPAAPRQLLRQPAGDVVHLLLGVPVSGVVGEQQLLRRGDDVVGRIHRRRRASLVVETPRIETRRGHSTRKVHDVVVLHRRDLGVATMNVWSFHCAEYMRPAAGSLIQIAADVRECGIVRGEPRHAPIEAGRDDGQRSALTAATGSSDSVRCSLSHAGSYSGQFELDPLSRVGHFDGEEDVTINIEYLGEGGTVVLVPGLRYRVDTTYSEICLQVSTEV
jgi:hypothetical protein